MNLIKKLPELPGIKYNRNWQQKGHSLALPQFYVFNCVFNNDGKRTSKTSGSKHCSEVEQDVNSTDFQDITDQMNVLGEKRIIAGNC